jgi:hypothetical protein
MLWLNQLKRRGKVRAGGTERLFPGLVEKVPMGALMCFQQQQEGCPTD